MSEPNGNTVCGIHHLQISLSFPGDAHHLLKPSEVGVGTSYNPQSKMAAWAVVFGDGQVRVKWFRRQQDAWVMPGIQADAVLSALPEDPGTNEKLSLYLGGSKLSREPAHPLLMPARNLAWATRRLAEDGRPFDASADNLLRVLAAKASTNHVRIYYQQATKRHGRI